MMEELKITIVAFRDDQKRSISYRVYETVEKAVEFYKSMLEKKDVNTISTRKIKDKVT